MAKEVATNVRTVDTMQHNIKSSGKATDCDDKVRMMSKLMLLGVHDFGKVGSHRHCELYVQFLLPILMLGSDLRQRDSQDQPAANSNDSRYKTSAATGCFHENSQNLLNYRTTRLNSTTPGCRNFQLFHTTLVETSRRAHCNQKVIEIASHLPENN